MGKYLCAVGDRPECEVGTSLQRPFGFVHLCNMGNLLHSSLFIIIIIIIRNFTTVQQKKKHRYSKSNELLKDNASRYAWCMQPVQNKHKRKRIKKVRMNRWNKERRCKKSKSGQGQMLFKVIPKKNSKHDNGWQKKICVIIFIPRNVDI